MKFSSIAPKLSPSCNCVIGASYTRCCVRFHYFATFTLTHCRHGLLGVYAITRPGHLGRDDLLGSLIFRLSLHTPLENEVHASFVWYYIQKINSRYYRGVPNFPYGRIPSLGLSREDSELPHRPTHWVCLCRKEGGGTGSKTDDLIVVLFHQRPSVVVYLYCTALN